MTKTILVADDSRTIRHVVSLTFVSTDFRVVPADSAKDALDRIKNERPDLVLADVGMPGVDGYQLCQELKQSAATSGIPVVLMAGAFEPFDEVRAEQARADGHIKKPFETQKLIEQVKTLLSAPPRAAAASPAPVSAPIAAAPPPAMQTYSSPAPRSPAIDDLVARPAPAAVAPPAAYAAPAPSAFAAPVAEQQPSRGGWDDIPVDDSEPMDMEEAEEGEAFAARAAAYGPSLEPPPAPDPEQEAQRRSVDVWALQDDGSVSPPRSRSVSVPVEEPEFYDEPSDEMDEPLEDEGLAEPSPMVEAIGRAAAPAVAAAVQPHTPGLTKEELVRLAREVIERVAWEVVPELAETIIREEIRRLMAEGP